MAVSQFLDAVKTQLSSNAQLLVESSSKDFQQALERWTNLGLKTPHAIVVVATEDDILNTVSSQILPRQDTLPLTTSRSNWQLLTTFHLLPKLGVTAFGQLPKESSSISVTSMKSPSALPAKPSESKGEP